MPTQVQSRRGTTAQHSTFTGAAGELTVDTDKKTVVVHDGSTAGGAPLLRENGSQNAVTTGTSTAASFIPTSSTAPTNGVYLPAANSVAISTNGTGRLFVDSSGNGRLGNTTSASSTAPVMWSLGGQYTPDASVAYNNLKFKIWDDGTVGAGMTMLQSGPAYVAQQGGHHLFFTSASGSPTERVRITSGGLVGIGATSPTALVDAAGANYIGGPLIGARYNAASLRMGIGIANANGFPFLGVNVNNNSNSDTGTFDLSNWASRLRLDNGSAIFERSTASGTAGGSITWTETVRIDSSSRLLVGTSSANTNVAAGHVAQVQIEGTGYAQSTLGIFANSNDANGSYLFLAKSRGTTAGSNTICQNDDLLGQIRFLGSDGSGDFSNAAYINAVVDGTPSSTSFPTRLVFGTTASGATGPTERMRISNSGDIIFVKSSTSTTTRGSYIQAVTGAFVSAQPDGGSSAAFYATSTGNLIGSIGHTATATAYNTSSDYRLKENIEPVTDGITRLQQLKPSRFNFIADPANTVDGFIAHEVQAVVPEAITGEKDALDADGNPIYQGIDQSKLVPLLTAALQEAIAKIETLEARLTALEAA